MLNPILDRTATADDIVSCLDEVGYAVVRELVEAETMDRLNAEFDPYLAQVPLGRTDFAGYRTKRFNAVMAKSKTSHGFATHPLILQVCDRVLLPHCARYHLHVTGVIELQPGERGQVLHRDGDIYPFRSEIPTTLPTIWACNDFTATNGGTTVVPGSHRWPQDRKPEPHEVVSTVMPRGSVLIYTSQVLHGGGANSSNVARRGMILHYNLGWLRQEENQYLTLPPDLARALPEEVARLIGYDFGGPYLGFVDSGDPMTLLRPDRPRDMARSSPEVDAAVKRVRPLLLSPRADAPGEAPHIVI